MAYTDIDDPSEYFGTTLYTGNETARAITFDGNSDLDVDWIWLKSRSASGNHHVYDTVRGTQKFLRTNLTNAEGTNGGTDGVTAFGSNGFTVGANTGSNQSGVTFVGWGWKAGTSFTNDASSTGIGSIDSAGSFNNDSGFSIVSYTGTGSAGTIKHGLSTTPKMIIQKNRDETQPWWTYVESIGAGGQLRLNATNAAGSDGATLWNSTAPTSSVFSVGDNTGTNGSSDKCIAYCFADVKGYSKVSGSYVGNGNVNGSYIHLGFSPSLVIQKEYGASGEYWMMKDNKRETGNQTDANLYPNASNAEGDTNGIDLLSNGFKCRTSGAGSNGSGKLYIYMAWASNPFVTSTGVPTTAR